MTGATRYCAGCGQHVPADEVNGGAHPVDSGDGPVACGEVVASRARAVEMIEAGLTQARQGLDALSVFAPASTVTESAVPAAATVTLKVTLPRSDVELVQEHGRMRLIGEGTAPLRMWNAVFDAATAEPAPPTGTAPTGLQRWDVWLTPEGTRRRVESMDADCGGDEFATFSPGLRQAGSKWVLRKWTLVERPEGTPYPAYTKDGDQ